MSLREADERDAEIAALKLRVAGLENDLRKATARAFYAEGWAKESEATICPMAIGDPHRFCTLATALSDTLARACLRHPDLAEWLDATAEEPAP